MTVLFVIIECEYFAPMRIFTSLSIDISSAEIPESRTSSSSVRVRNEGETSSAPRRSTAMKRSLLPAFLICLLALTALPARGEEAVPSPAEHLGHPVGADFHLSSWPVVFDYYNKLANASSRVDLQVLGKTTEGRDFCVAVISSEENLKNLDQIRKWSKIIADPRGNSPEEIQEAVTKGKVTLVISLTMHSNEPASTEMGMQLAYELATSTDHIYEETRKNVVVVLIPSLNPDGTDLVSSWYHKHLGTQYEASSLPRLYQYYTGHDNNRDFFGLTQIEARYMTQLLYHDWNPQIMWDVHQQGGARERFFVPPYRDPLNPNIDPAIVAGMNVIGTRAVMDMTRDGLTGIATGVSYDNWWNGGNRSVPARHNIIGILTEAASCYLATPRFYQEGELSDPLGRKEYSPSNQFISPWRGGWWRLQDIVRYELSFARSLLGTISREPTFWLQNKLEATERAIANGKAGGPRGWLIPTDNTDIGALSRLADILLLSGVEVRVATSEFTADGRSYPAGTLVLLRDQPYGNFLKDLFELQEFPKDSRPYDVAGWVLPHLLGIRRVQIEHDVQVPTVVASTVSDVLKPFRGDPRLANAPAGATSIADSRSWTDLVARLSAGEARHLAAEGELAGLWVSGVPNSGRGSGKVVSLTSLPRIGIYSPWTGVSDQGWMRWVFDSMKIPYQLVTNEAIRAGELTDVYDVLIIPSMASRLLNDGRSAIEPPFQGGLATEGVVAIQQFVREGGTLITCGTASGWAIQELGLPVVDVTSEKGNGDFSCSGSVLRVVPEDNALMTASPREAAIFFSASAAYRPMTSEERAKSGGDSNVTVTPMLRYASHPVLLSGHIVKPEVIENKAAWMQANYGNGTVHLFGFSPHYRAWSQGSFHLLMRAVFLPVK